MLLGNNSFVARVNFPATLFNYSVSSAIRLYKIKIAILDWKFIGIFKAPPLLAFKDEIFK